MGGEPHPDVARLVQRFEHAEVPTYDMLSAEQARALCEGVLRLQRPAPAIKHVEDLTLPGPAGPLRARLYRPAGHAQRPLVVHFHGGGWVLGSLTTADAPCQRLAALSECAVLSVDYRLAPETPFPGPLEDCLAAVRWAADHRGRLGGDERLVVFGDSAGGNLATSVALRLRDAGEHLLDAQLLLYPVLAPARGSTSQTYVTQADGPLMTARELVWFWDQYLPGAQGQVDPRAAPLQEADLSGLPPTWLELCELDPLRDEGLAYARRLTEDGVIVHVHVEPGAAHGYWWMDGALSQATGLTDRMARALQSVDHQRPQSRARPHAHPEE